MLRLPWKDSGFGQVSLGHEHVANLLVADREIALPAGVIGIGLGEAVCNVETALEGFKASGGFPAPRARRQPYRS